MALILKAGDRKFQVVRNRASFVAGKADQKAADRKMMADSVRSVCNTVTETGMKAMRAASRCGPGDSHKAAMEDIKGAITHAAMASYDAGYYADSTAAHSVDSSKNAAAMFRKAMKSAGAVSDTCGKCSGYMKAAVSAMDRAATSCEMNAGIEPDDTMNDADGDEAGAMKRFSDRLHAPNSLITFGDGIKKIGDRKYAGFLVRFTGPDKRDADGEFFDKETDFMTGVFPIKGAMSLYNHGMDKSIASCPIGNVTSVEVRADGIYIEQEYKFFESFKAYLTELKAPDKWKQTQLALAKRYDEIIQEMLDDGTLGWSSGAHSASVVKNQNGHIDRWPIIEASATPIPAMPFETKIQPVKFLLAEQRLQNAREVAA